MQCTGDESSIAGSGRGFFFPGQLVKTVYLLYNILTDLMVENDHIIYKTENRPLSYRKKEGGAKT